MKQKSINGLNEHQVFQLYDYLVAYEDSGIQNYKSTIKLLSEHPELSKIVEYNKKIDVNISTAVNMNDINLKELNNKVYLSINKGNFLLSLLSHLRNAIAHGNAVMDNNYILVSDRNPRKSIDFTARGRIELSIINEISNILKGVKL